MTSKQLKTEIVFGGLYRVESADVYTTDKRQGSRQHSGWAVPVADMFDNVYMVDTKFIDEPEVELHETLTPAAIKQILTFEDPMYGQALLEQIEDDHRVYNVRLIKTRADLYLFEFVADLREWAILPSTHKVSEYDQRDVLKGVQLFHDHGPYWTPQDGVTLVRVGEKFNKVTQIECLIKRMNDIMVQPNPENSGLMVKTCEAVREYVREYDDLPKSVAVEWEYTQQLYKLLSQQRREVHDLMQWKREALAAVEDPTHV